jgi:class 3 adenylate cyclase
MPDRPEEETPAEIQAFLIADVRGYTLFTQERGDEAAAKLASKFADMAREGVTARGGSVIELRGDEALAVFRSARQAIRAAVDLQKRFVEETIADPAMPMPVGIGIDAGEAVPVQGGYRGGALNLAARLCGRAGPGEIVASREASHLARKIDGVRYVDEGEVSLKNLTQPVGVVRIVPEDGDPAEYFRSAAAEREQLESEQPPADGLGQDLVGPRPAFRPHRADRRVAVALMAVVAIGIAAIVTFSLTRETAGRKEARSLSVPRNRLLRLDPLTGKLGASVPISPDASALAAGGGYVWVVDPKVEVVYQVAQKSNRVIRRIPVGAEPKAVSFSGDAASSGVWVANRGDGTVWRLDADSGRVLAKISVGHGVSSITAAEDQVWAVNGNTGLVSRIDPTSNQVIASFQEGDVAVFAIDSGRTWLMLPNLVRPRPGVGFVELRGEIFQLNPNGRRRYWGFAYESGVAGSFLVDGDTAWVYGAGPDIVQIDLSASARELGSYPHIRPDRGPEQMVLDGSGNPWGIAQFSKAIFKVSAVTRGLSTFALPGQPLAIAADSGGVFVLFRP